MRSLTLAFICAVSLIASRTAPASDGNGAFAPGTPLMLAHDEDRDRDHDHDDDEPPTREELRQRKRELKEDERELRRQEREERVERVVRKPLTPRIWVGVGAGVAFASVDVPCAPGTADYDCSEEGQVGTYSANVTFSGPYTALRVRGIRQQDKGRDARTPYEEAAMIGSRFGRSDWYGFVGAGRIQHADDEFEGDTHGFAWEILFAPSSFSATGFELSFQGNAGEDVDFVGFNLGARFGALR